jgi:hypothetical protein
MAYTIGALPLDLLFSPVTRATAALVRLDERLAQSPIRGGFLERQHFHDAAAALWIEGELIHQEDLVLHDARMDHRAPTHELTRAHAVLRARRRIFAHASEWALGPGLRQLTGRNADMVTPEEHQTGKGAGDDKSLTRPDTPALEFAEIDALIVRSTKALADIEAGRRTRTLADDRPSLVYDLDWDEDARLAEWQAVLQATCGLPAVLRAALLIDAWAEIEVLQHAAWLGPLLAAALLRQSGTTDNHLAALFVGLRAIRRDLRCSRDRTVRHLAVIDAIGEAASAGLKEHDRLVMARGQVERRLRNRRKSSKLPQLVDLVMARPLVSTTMVQEELKLTRQGAINLISELGLRELTGRKRYQAWGIV